MASRYIDPNSIALDPTAVILAVASDNPRKPGTRGHAFFPRYAVGQTIGDLLAAAKRDKIGDAPAHVRWDLSRSAVIVSNLARKQNVDAIGSGFVERQAIDAAVTAAILGA